MTSAPSYRQQRCGLGDGSHGIHGKKGVADTLTKQLTMTSCQASPQLWLTMMMFPKQQLQLNNQSSCQNCDRIKLRLLLNIVLLKDFENKIDAVMVQS